MRGRFGSTVGRGTAGDLGRPGSAGIAAGDLAEQEGAGDLPVALQGALGDFGQRRDLLEGLAREEAPLDQARQLGVDRREPLEGAVEREQLFESGGVLGAGSSAGADRSRSSAVTAANLARAAAPARSRGGGGFVVAPGEQPEEALEGAVEQRARRGVGGE